MNVTLLSIAASASFWLAPAAAGTATDPREDLGTLIAHTITLLEAKQFSQAIDLLVDDELLKMTLEIRNQSLENFAAEWGSKRGPKLLGLLRAIRNRQPEQSDDGRKATYKIDQPEGRRSLVFTKSGRIWSLDED